MIGIINYGAGNLGSVMNALSRLNAEARFVRGPEELTGAATPFEKIIFPGDGHFANAVKSLREQGYGKAIAEWIKKDKPFLGICIGLQLLFESSEEAPLENGAAIQGLAEFKGRVRRFPGAKVPQIGWNETFKRRHSAVFSGLKDGDFFYYIHSYYVEPEDGSSVIAVSNYSLEFCAALERGALCALQFHPEKSGAAGLALLNNWLNVK